MKAISLLFSFLLCPAWLILSQATDYYYQKDCYPKSCGPLVNVTFPFWLRGRQPEYCGLPAFEIRCEDDVPRLVLLQEENRVLNISYENRTATISTATVSEANGCGLPYYNLSSFSLSSFAISSANRELVFVFNCTAPTARFVKFSCLDKNIYAYLGGAFQRTEDGGGLHSCFEVVMPVLSSPGANVDQYKELLAKGFLLDWNAPDCSECLTSNGQCGRRSRKLTLTTPKKEHTKVGTTDNMHALPSLSIESSQLS
ncbi:hypothetical protein HPP92_027413 [Vanilla planifolia]|uniref:Uncharacterized protein n=1 Tax=Vanilla planifolia TaxID=51239 RepID=A0A835PBW9_VANPL|nr:hypothetical protein HPP92_027413 [Vanilla planifolia]